MTVWSRRDDAVDVQGIASVLTVRDGVRNQSVSVVDPSGLGEVNHRVGIVLLVARVCTCKKGIDTVDARKVDAWFICEDISTADKLYMRHQVRTSGWMTRG